MEHLMPEIREKEKKTVISVVGKREWDPSLGRWLFWEWTETWILVHGRETSFALWEVERWRREVDLINLQPAAVYYCLGQLLLDILPDVLKMFNTSQMAIFLMQKPKCSIFSECKKWDTKDYYRLHFEIRLIFNHVWLYFLLLFFLSISQIILFWSLIRRNNWHFSGISSDIFIESPPLKMSLVPDLQFLEKDYLGIINHHHQHCQYHHQFSSGLKTIEKICNHRQ